MSKTILIVEDYKDIRESLKLWLEMYGYETLEAADGDEAVEYVKKLRPDLVLMDIGLPSMIGISATRQIRKLDEGKLIPVIVVTAYKDGLRKQALQAGCNQVIGKPIEFESILSIISSYF